MIPLNKDQRHALHCITHDLMLVTAMLPSNFQEALNSVAATLYEKVLLSTEDEAIDCIARAETELWQRLDTAHTPRGVPN